MIANDDEIIKIEESLQADFTKLGLSATKIEKIYSYVIKIDLKKGNLDTLIDKKINYH